MYVRVQRLFDRLFNIKSNKLFLYALISKRNVNISISVQIEIFDLPVTAMLLQDAILRFQFANVALARETKGKRF